MRVWIIVLALALGPAVSNGFARFGYGLILPAMQSDLGWSYTAAGWINTANAVGYLAGALLALGYSALFGPVRLFQYGMVVTAAALALSGFTDDFSSLIALRVLAGIGGAPVFIAGGAMAATLFASDSSKNALAIALYFGGGGAGILMTALLLPPMLETWGAASWPYTWRALGALSLVSLLPAWWGARRVSDSPRGRGERLVFPPWRRLTPSLAGYFLFAAGYIVYMTFVVAWMRESGSGAAMVVATWGLLGLAVMVSPFVWRRVLAVYANGVPLGLASVATGLAVILPFAIPGRGGLLLSAAGFGLSFFVAPTAATSFAKKNMPRAQWSAAVALYTTAFALGQTLGPIGAGWIADAGGGLSASLWAGALALLAGGMVCFFQRPLSLPAGSPGPN